MTLMAACHAPKPQPPVNTVVEVSSMEGTFIPQHLFDDSLATGWEVRAVGKHELLRLIPERAVYIDTLRFEWQQRDSLIMPESMRVYAQQQLVGAFAPNDYLILNDSIKELEVAFEFPLQPICMQPESQQAFCLLRKRKYPLAVLAEIHGVNWGAENEMRTFPKNKEIPKLPLPFYRGVRQGKKEAGVALHAWGGFASHVGDTAYFGAWEDLGNGKVALVGKSPLHGLELADTLTIHWGEQGLEAVEWGDRYLPEHLPDSAFVALRQLGDFAYDLRYATDNNFMGEAVYPCGDCWLRYEAAQALLKAQELLLAQGYDLLLYDCYRPVSVQKRMWEIYPNPMYVANPYKGIGSIHNRGGAVDLTVIDQNGEPLKMGSPYDHFGVEAHQDNFNLPEEVLANRALFREAMTQSGYRTIRTEWWHYSYRNKTKFRVADIEIACP